MIPSEGFFLDHLKTVLRMVLDSQGKGISPHFSIPFSPSKPPVRTPKPAGFERLGGSIGFSPDGPTTHDPHRWRTRERDPRSRSHRNFQFRQFRIHQESGVNGRVNGRVSSWSELKVCPPLLLMSSVARESFLQIPIWRNDPIHLPVVILDG